MLEIVTLASTLLLIAVLLYIQHKILKELKNIRIPPPQKVEVPPAKEVVLDLNPVIEAIKGIRIPEPQKIEFPKIEIPKIEIPKIEIPKIEVPKMEVPKIELPKIELPKIEIPKIEIPKIELPNIEIPQAKDININTETLQEIVTLMRVNQAEFQSGLEAFHKAIDKLLVQIPSGEKELDAQKEFMQKFEAAFAKIQEQATEAMNDNSLRLQEILSEFLNKERSNG
ncbi:MAG: hypothetical protein LBC87_09515 [Fibromonadaceae bacterium]|jgi:hypothetical protein|nr:hypothetical protein [Fibromonadaceae bacterium]